MSTNDIRVSITVRNNLMLRAMEAAGIYSARALATKSCVNYQRIINYLNLKAPPIDKHEQWRPCAMKLAMTLGLPPDDLFPAAFLRQALATNRVEREVAAAAIMTAGRIQATPETAMIVHEGVDALMAEIRKLTPREQITITHIYGLGDALPKTLDQVGAMPGMNNVTRERVRQILMKGQRKLQRLSADTLRPMRAAIEHMEDAA